VPTKSTHNITDSPDTLMPGFEVSDSSFKWSPAGVRRWLGYLLNLKRGTTDGFVETISTNTLYLNYSTGTKSDRSGCFLRFILGDRLCTAPTCP